MIYLYIRAQVVDYDRWREGYDLHAAAREAGGATSEAYVLRDSADPNDITAMMGWSSLEQAQAFAQSTSLHDAAQMAGVKRISEIRFLQPS